MALWLARPGFGEGEMPALFLPADKPSECVWLLQDLECKLTVSEARGTYLPKMLQPARKS